MKDPADNLAALAERLAAALETMSRAAYNLSDALSEASDVLPLDSKAHEVLAEGLAAHAVERAKRQ